MRTYILQERVKTKGASSSAKGSEKISLQGIPPAYPASKVKSARPSTTNRRRPSQRSDYITDGDIIKLLSVDGVEVGTATVLQTDPKCTVHGQPLGKKDVKIHLVHTYSQHKSVPLPEPVDEKQTLGELSGEVLRWPRNRAAK